VAIIENSKNDGADKKTHQKIGWFPRMKSEKSNLQLANVSKMQECSE